MKVTLAPQVVGVVLQMPAAVFQEIGAVSAELRTDLSEFDDGFEQFLALLLRGSVGSPQDAGRKLVHCVAQHPEEELIALFELA
jgi:hypothetical protein